MLCCSLIVQNLFCCYLPVLSPMSNQPPMFRRSFRQWRMVLLCSVAAFANGELTSGVPMEVSPVANGSPLLFWGFRQWRMVLLCSVAAFANGELTSGVPMEVSPVANGSPLLFWGFRHRRTLQVGKNDLFFNQNRCRL